ncbi:protein-tyrosine-phosphatase [Saccharomonospora azurea NA-128]|uniref:protein-tyrosine-phosphatase n=2 Tax=Saccharomonospora azurea TaxID=40988 RepID=H8G7N3_9PSEU|nr:protein-tyrosine-phosphatase [Saccharomonospora azurea NA-128]
MCLAFFDTKSALGATQFPNADETGSLVEPPDTCHRTHSVRPRHFPEQYHSQPFDPPKGAIATGETLELMADDSTRARVDATHDTTSIVFVCSGNICRSPMAEIVFRRRLAEHGLGDAVTVRSAGTGGWHVGEPADPRARETLAAHGYPVEHTARQVGHEHLDADLLVAADKSHLRDLRVLVDDPDRVRLLRSFDPTAPADAEVPDPYYGGDEGFVEVLGMIERAVDGLLDWVRQR